MKVQVKDLHRTYGRFHAVQGISFEFGSGQTFGFIGPNGAGKSTTMRIIATLDEPTSGTVHIDGISILDEPEKARRLVGYVPDSLPTHRDISVHEYLDFFARSYGIRGEKRRQVVEDIEEFTNLGGIRDKHLPALSKGMKNRVSVARALVHDPQVLIMDEPASGLDPRARIELRELLKALAANGKAILISSHILTELAEICTGAVIIERGKIRKAGTLAELLKDTSPHRTYAIRPIENLRGLQEYLLTRPGVEAVRLIEQELEVDIVGEEAACAELLSMMIRDGWRISEFRQKRTGLEQIFMDLTKGEVQ